MKKTVFPSGEISYSSGVRSYSTNPNIVTATNIQKVWLWLIMINLIYKITNKYCTNQ